MIATYNNHRIEALRGEGGLYHALIDGEPANIEPSKYKLVAIRRAKEACQEQERQQEPMRLKEIGL
jgi:hypothetical protein